MLERSNQHYRDQVRFGRAGTAGRYRCLVVGFAAAALRLQTPGRVRWAPRPVLYGLSLALGLGLPFEPLRPLLSLPGLELNHLKLLLGAGALVWFAGPARRQVRQLWPAALFLGLAAISALLAPVDRAEALRFSGRLATDVIALALGLTVATSPRHLAGLVGAIAIGAGISALLGLGEAAGWPSLAPLLGTFKVAPTRVGGELRVSASFQYATIAAMYFELVAPLAVALAAASTNRLLRWLATLVVILSSSMVALSLTRAGLLALLAAFGLLLGLAWRQPAWRGLVTPTLFGVAGLGLSLLGLGLRDAAFATRVATENDWGWYAASYDAPAALDLAADGPVLSATIVAHNSGAATWTPSGEHPFALAYRWLTADGTAELALPAVAIDLPADVPPGQAVALSIPVQVPPSLAPDDYRLAWGMQQRNVLWFHDRGDPDAETLVHVAAPAGPQPGSTPAPVALAPRSDAAIAEPPVPRLQLWRAALLLWGAHPLLGIGPDNFRHVYGAVLGLDQWDVRVHANNLYLELLADLGLLGSLAWWLIVLPAISSVVGGLRAQPGGPAGVWLAGLGASLVAYGVHGALDAFLGFTSVATLFWLIVGLSSALDRGRAWPVPRVRE